MILVALAGDRGDRRRRRCPKGTSPGRRAPPREPGDRQLGALITTVVVVNTGFLGLPMAVALLHARSLGTAVAYDQLISGPALPISASGWARRSGSVARAASVNGCERSCCNPPLMGVVAGLLAPPSLAPAPLPPISHVVVGSLLLQAGMPSGVNTLIVGQAYDLDLRLISGIVVWSTLVVLVAGLVLSLLV